MFGNYIEVALPFCCCKMYIFCRDTLMRTSALLGIKGASKAHKFGARLCARQSV